MKCQNCGGEIQFDKENAISVCPFCGSEVQPEPEVMIERIKADKDIKVQQMKMEETRRENQSWDRTRLILGIILFGAIIIFAAYSIITF